MSPFEALDFFPVPRLREEFQVYLQLHQIYVDEPFGYDKRTDRVGVNSQVALEFKYWHQFEWPRVKRAFGGRSFKKRKLLC